MGFSQLLAVLPLVSAAVVQPLAYRDESLGPAAEVVAAPNTQLFDYETVQLTDKVLDDIKDQVPDVSIFSFQEDETVSGKRETVAKGPLKKCKTYPGDSLWPSPAVWDIFNKLSGNALIKTVPEPSICYPSWGAPNAAKCASLTTTWNNSTLRIEHPVSIRSVLFQGMTCMPPDYTAAFLGNTGTCTVGGFPEYSVNITQVYQVQLAVNLARELDLRLVIKNTGHDFGAKSTGKGALNIWTHNLKEAHYYPTYKASGYTGPAAKFGAGIQVFEAYRYAKKNGFTVIGGEGRTVGLVGGYTQGGGHSPLSSIYGMGADHVLSVQLVTADGRFITADANNNKDIFWAVRGGGGSTFGVVTSMTYKVFPTIKATIMTYNMTTGPNFSKETFWAAQKAYVDEFERLADLGFYAYYRIRHVNGEIFHDVTSMVAPNKTEVEFRAILAPLWAKWAALGVPFYPSLIREYSDFNDGFVDGFPQEPWTWTMRQASRLVPRENIADPSRRQQMFDSLREVFDGGANLILFNIRNPPGAASIDNAVNPAWRKVLMFALMFVTWDVKAAPEYVTELSRNLTYTWNPKWRALTPGAGTYMSESDYIEPNWQQSFHGDKYARLYSIKQKVDPRGVFYAQNAVGSENYQMSETLLGHLPSQNSKLCRK